jgi:ADP-ribosylglycohydrolase
MLIELAIGDAYGAGFEYVKDEIVRTRNTLEAYLGHARHNIAPGQYTDDTQMAHYRIT